MEWAAPYGPVPIDRGRVFSYWTKGRLPTRALSAGHEKGNTVRFDPSRGTNAAAALATVSGDCLLKIHWLCPGRGAGGRTREPGDLPIDVTVNERADGVAWRRQ